MKQHLPEVELVMLAPEPEVSLDIVRGYATQLADILNNDMGLPPEMKRSSGAPLKTTESVLAFTRNWCRERNALSFAVVVGGKVAGLISLSHMDIEAKQARTGYFIASSFQNRGIGTQALSRLFDIAQENGFEKVTASIEAGNIASRRIWEKCGASFEFTDDDATAYL
ncbi:MAG: hypothetical protein A2516_06250 [Alphaproteobacteria bacterium RIFOXYD12_FULL_60_8]|nr:MAG: hypothetical protein A2516_06250 [Alphaproteobacteria bacterium RIFOXYD12_FULL_60_8]